MTEPDIERRWWKEAVVYQVYPRSFNDSDGDGVGDLQGITEQVDYLDELGIDVVWLNPVYESPNADGGYDISDYREIAAEFGTMADWEALLDALHERDIRLIMDLVVNHTSDEHDWFVRSRENDPEYVDFYWWREGTDPESVPWDSEEGEGPDDEAPPNGWMSVFGGPAWSYDEVREAWYLHLFDRKQPDLNWRNTDVRGAVYEMMAWWLETGIDGFRLDAVAHIAKAESLPTDLDAPLGGLLEYAGNVPHVHEYLTEMNERVLERDLLTVAEVTTPTVPTEDVKTYLDPDRDGLSMLTHAQHMNLDRGDSLWEVGRWSLSELKAVIDRWDVRTSEEGWVAQYLSGHDQPRQVSRFGSEHYRRKSAKLLGTLIHTLRGTPFVYQGEELGMTNYPWESLEEFRDVATTNPVERAIARGEIDSFEQVGDAVAAWSRDNSRTPMQWSGEENAGFTDGEPWIGVNPNYTEVNVAAARDNPDSVYQYYRELIALRSDDAIGDLVAYGAYEQLAPDHESLWTHTRTLGDDALLVTLNFSDSSTAISFPADPAVGGVDDDEPASLLLANDDIEDTATIAGLADGTLGPWEARVYRVDSI